MACVLPQIDSGRLYPNGLNKERNNSPELREELQNGSVFFPLSQNSRVAQQFVVPNVLVDVDGCTEVLEEEHRGAY
jgi:hypothetical protein